MTYQEFRWIKDHENNLPGLIHGLGAVANAIAAWKLKNGTIPSENRTDIYKHIDNIAVQLQNSIFDDIAASQERK